MKKENTKTRYNRIRKRASELSEKYKNKHLIIKELIAEFGFSERTIYRCLED